MSALILVESNHSSLHFFRTYFFSFQIETENHFVNFQFYKKNLWQKHYNCQKDMRFHKSGETNQVIHRLSLMILTFFFIFFITFTIICQVIYIFTQFTVIFNNDNHYLFNKLMLKTLLGPRSHTVEANEEWSSLCCQAGRGLGTDCRCSRSDWGRLYRPVSVSSVIITARSQLGYSFLSASWKSRTITFFWRIWNIITATMIQHFCKAAGIILYIHKEWNCLF